MKLLILADIAAPYRVSVFKGLAQCFDVTVFFNYAKNAQRDPKWFAQSGKELEFHFLNTEESIEKYNHAIAKIQDFDVVLCYDPWASRSRTLQRLCIRKHIPYVLNADGALGINTKFPKKQIKSYYVKRAALCFAGCARAAEYFKAYGAKDNRIVKHPFTSIGKEQILSAPLSVEQKMEQKTALGMLDKTTFITVGQFIHRKGIDLLLDAWSKTEQEAQLYIIGGGPLADEYAATVASKSLKNVFIEGFKEPQELRKYYLASDVYVMPTREDIWGLVINEAMACALPIITSDRCTAGNELVKDDLNGYHYACENTDQLASYIKKMTEDASLRQSFSENTLSVIKDQTFENIIEGHIAALKDLLHQ